MSCDTTACQVFHNGYKVAFLRDATGTLTFKNEAGRATAEEREPSILITQQMSFSEAIATDAWKKQGQGT